MKTAIYLVLVIALLAALPACGRGEGGAAGYGAGGGQSLREGSTSPLHSSIAQDETYQKLLGLNILLYPPPVDDPKFESYGSPAWDLDATSFVKLMKDNFKGQMGDQAVYEPKVEALQNDPLIAQIQEKIYGGKPVQVGWIYGNNAKLDFMETNGENVTLIPADNTVVFTGKKADVDPTNASFDIGKASAFYLPANAVVTFYTDTLRSAPLRIDQNTGVLTAVIVPVGVGVEKASPGTGIDQALVAKSRWVFGQPGNSQGYFEGLTGGTKEIVPVN